MSVTRSCPGSDCWQALLVADLPPDEREQLERHLELCPDCQTHLDQPLEDGDELLRLVRQVGSPATGSADPTLTRILEQLHELQPPAQGEPGDLYFLQPAGRPDLLGMLGEYEVQEVIGQGGMGVVLKAFEPALHRLVAIKVMAAAVAGSATARKRFTREAQAAAAVCHEHVVAVHGVHETDGLPYLVMQYVAGESLQDRLDRSGPLELMEIVRIGHQTASGLAAAHAQGLIHRDIKPANLLLEAWEGEAPAEPGQHGSAGASPSQAGASPSQRGGRVKITDFGLARMVDDAQLTQNGVVAGTPEYMAPEQARGETVDHRGDLFSLGSLLYAACTGVPPFRGASAVAVLRQVSDQEPVPVRTLNPDIPAWLETVILRLLAKDPRERFQSAAEVAALLEGYLAHLRQPATVLAPELPSSPAADCTAPGQPRLQSQIVRWLPQLLWLAALLLLVPLGLGLAHWLAGGVGHTSAKRQRPDAPPKQAELQLDFRSLDPASPDWRPIGQKDFVQIDSKGARLTLPAGQGKIWHTGFMSGFAVRGDFTATFSFEILKADTPDTGYGVGVSIYAAVDPKTNDAVSLARRVGLDGKAVYFSNRMKLVDGKPTHNYHSMPATADAGKLRLQRVGSTIRFLVADGPDADFVLLNEVELGASDIRLIQMGGDGGGSESALDARLLRFTLQAQELPGRTELAQVDPPSPQGTPPQTRGKGWLAAALLIGLFLVLGFVALGTWLYFRRRPAETSPAPTAVHDNHAVPAPSAMAVSFPCSGCRKTLKARAELGGKKVKCPQCGQAVLVPSIRVDLPSAPPPAPTAPASRSRGLTAWLLLCLVPLCLVVLYFAWPSWAPHAPGKAGWLNVVLGREPVSGIDEAGFSIQEYDKYENPFRWTDGNARLVIPVDKQTPPRSLDVHVHNYRPQAQKSDLHILVNDRTLFHEQISQGRWQQTFDLKGIDLGEKVTVQVRSDTFSPRKHLSDDDRILGVQVRGIRLLGPVEGVAEPAAPDHTIPLGLNLPEGPCGGALTANGKTLVVGAWDGTIAVWDLTTHQERYKRIGLVPGLVAVAVSPDGSTFATAGRDRMVRIWDLETGQPRHELRGHAGQLVALAYAPDGKTLAAAGGNPQKAGELRLWDVAAGQERVPVAPLGRRLWGVAYSPDGQWVAVAGGDGTVSVVSTSTGQVGPTFSHPLYAHGVAFSPDGQLLAVTYGDEGQVRIYELSSNKLRSSFQGPLDRYVGPLQYSPDGKRLLAPCLDGLAVIWDVSQPQAQTVALLKGHEDQTRFAVFGPDGRSVVSGDDRAIRLWQAPSLSTSADSPAASPPTASWNMGFVGGGLLALALTLFLSVWFWVGRSRRSRERPARALDQVMAPST
jgi:serine/threonine protein kinase/WD40 repeat protein